MAAFARRQKGNVTRIQLLDAGVTSRMIRRRLDLGALHQHPGLPGVYLVGHRAQPPLARECAALLYCAPRAMLSHRTATRGYELPAPPIDEIEVTMVGRRLKSRPGLRVYTISSILPAELHRHCGLPITSPSLTLLDLAGVVGDDDLARALNEARVQELVTDEEIHATLRAHPNRRGARALRALMGREEAEFVVDSEAERLCLRLMIKHGLKPDQTQAWIGPYRVDFLYEVERLVVEADSYRFHRTKKRFVADRRRIAYLVSRGYEVLPLTWWDLTGRPAESMTRVREAREARRRLLNLPAL